MLPPRFALALCQKIKSAAAEKTSDEIPSAFKQGTGYIPFALINILFLKLKTAGVSQKDCKYFFILQ